MKYYSKRWQRAIAALCAVICLAASLSDVVVKSANTHGTKAKIVKLDEKLGVEPGAVLAELSAHENDGYYLGTPYDSDPFTEENCMRPNGAYAGKGGMNCTGFVASVLEKCGADLSGIASGDLSGGKINASNWFNWMQDNSVENYHFNTIDELLQSGRAQKGDVIYFEPVSWDEPGADCHIGFFWGNSGNDNLFWHSALKPRQGNQISELTTKSPSTVYLFKITHTGNLEIYKSSANPELTDGNGCYFLGGAEYTLYKYGTTEKAAVIITDENGYGKVTGIEEGMYEICETKPPKGYALDERRETIVISAGETAVYECEDYAKRNPLELLLEKCDDETGEKVPQGSASFAGAEFTVCYYDVIAEKDPGADGKVPTRTWVFRTDEEAKVHLSEEYQVSGDALYIEDGMNVLPLGTVTIKETKAPEGYRLSEEVFVRTIREEEGNTGEIVQTYQETVVPEAVIRGDLELIKVADGTQQRMANVPFRLTSKTTGESHIIVTDKNGYVSTASEWTPHTQNTNEGKTSDDGVWFGGGEPDDENGALVYDTYLVEEMECEANKKHMLIPPFEVEISRDMYRVKLGTLTDDAKPIPEISTTARDRDSGTNNGAAKKDAVIIDKVSYYNLEVGKEYMLQGILMDKASGEPLIQDGKTITAEKIFMPLDSNGTVEMKFCLDASKLNGKSVVIFEKLYQAEEEVAVHADIKDEGQTVSYERPIPKTPDVPSVKTGDNENVAGLILCALLSCITVVSVCCRRMIRRS